MVRRIRHPRRRRGARGRSGAHYAGPWREAAGGRRLPRAPVATGGEGVSRLAKPRRPDRLPGGRAATGPGAVPIGCPARGGNSGAGKRDTGARALASVAEEILERAAALLLFHPAPCLPPTIQPGAA